MQSAPASGGKLKKILIIVGIVVGVLAALGAGVFFLVYSLTKGPADAAEKFLRDIGTDQVEIAYNGTAGVFRQYTTLAELKEGVAQNPVLADLRDVSLPNRSIQNSDAEVSGTVTSKGGVTVEVLVSLQKENGAWKVTSMEVGGVGAPQEEAGGGTGSEEPAAENGSAVQNGAATPETEAPAPSSAGALPEPPKEGQGIFVRSFTNAGEGRYFDLYDATGKNKLDSYQPVNTLIDLGVGTYTLYRYGSTKHLYAAQVVVQAKKVAVVTVGAMTLTVPAGASEGSYFDVYDATGKEKIESYQPGNTIISFGSGTYTLYRYGNNKIKYAGQMIVKAGELATASLGAMQFNGASYYDVYDEAGGVKLQSYQAPNAPVAYPAGTYVLKKYGTVLELGKVTVVAGKIAVAP